MNIGIGGVLSSGKTNLLVKFLTETNKKRIISNIQLNSINYFYQSDRDFIKFLKENIYNKDILKERFQDSFWLFDEIGNVINARTPNNPINLLVTSFIMMLGKLDCDLAFSYQIKESQVDKRLRELTDLDIECTRIYADGMPVIQGSRYLDVPIMIVYKSQYNLGIFGKIPKIDIYDPSPYYPLYNSKEMILFDPNEYKKIIR